MVCVEILTHSMILILKKPSLTQDLPKLNLKYSNKTLSYKTDISFLNIKIKNGNINKYEDYLEKYFADLGAKKFHFLLIFQTISHMKLVNLHIATI